MAEFLSINFSFKEESKYLLVEDQENTQTLTHTF